ncbi:uncharacterized protein RCO7_15034 [Rhynchosporium graminicola]|uniref:Uncharacterized protein n=1 Tax=Rhynchosporium graminicola TaxID=2792576 RepID=A0A1E1LGE6_9HELO|nr:uncharacterized protein RCO7_15034 [Rhynchosporium commune]
MSLSQLLSEQKRHAWFAWCAVLRRFGYERYQEDQGFHGPRLLNHARNLSKYR